MEIFLFIRDYYLIGCIISLLLTLICEIIIKKSFLVDIDKRDIIPLFMIFLLSWIMVVRTSYLIYRIIQYRYQTKKEKYKW